MEEQQGIDSKADWKNSVFGLFYLFLIDPVKKDLVTAMRIKKGDRVYQVTPGIDDSGLFILNIKELKD